jgi:HEAT repeat protein
METFRCSSRFIALLAAMSLIADRTSWAADLLSVPSEAQLIETLRTGTPAEKAIACKQLSVYGNQAAVPELAKLLAEKEFNSWSRIALEAIPDPAADEALLDAAKSLEGRLLVGTINSIGVRRSSGAVDHLTTRLKDENTDVATAAAVALGRIGNDAATKTLRQSLTTSAPAVRSAVAEGCILCAERLMAEGKNDAAAEIYDEVRKADLPQQRILEATRGAIVSRGTGGIPLLIEQLKSPDEKLFQIALCTARELPGRDVAAALAAQLAGVGAERAPLVIVAIGDIREAVLPPTVLQAARDGDPRLRLAAIQVVGKLGDAESVPVLLDIATDSEEELSQAAKIALVELSGDKVNAELAKRLTTAEDETLAVLIDLVGERRIDATAELAKALKHSNAAVRSAALTALGATAGPKELKVLIAEVTDAKNPDDTEAAAQALQTASVRMPDREATAAQLTAALPRASTEKKAQLLRILGAMGGPAALETIAKAAQSDEPELQDVGTRVLGEWMTADAAPQLYAIASSDHQHKTRALRGYLRIARQLDIPDAQRLEMCRKALAIAERAEERSLALEAMKRCPSADSIKLATALLDDAEVRQRAVEAAIFIGEQIKDEHPAAAAAAGKKALETRPPRQLAERARALTRVQQIPQPAK